MWTFSRFYLPMDCCLFSLSMVVFFRHSFYICFFSMHRRVYLFVYWNSLGFFISFVLFLVHSSGHSVRIWICRWELTKHCDRFGGRGARRSRLMEDTERENEQRSHIDTGYLMPSLKTRSVCLMHQTNQWADNVWFINRDSFTNFLHASARHTC